MQENRIKIVRPTLPSIEAIQDQFSECLESGMVSNSKYVQAFETELQKFFDSKLKPICFCNGEMALYNLIRAHKIKHNIPDGSGVLVPSLTFVGTINAIVANNLKPVFCDVDDTLTVSGVNVIESMIETAGNISMIVAVGVYGNLPNIEAILNIANGIPVILDTAPAFGSTYNGDYPDKFADCIYSFHATKKFSTMEGGCAITNDQQVYEILVQLRDFGQVEKVTGNVIHPGLNSKMLEVCAIIGLENLKTFKTTTEIGKRYDDFFADIPEIEVMRVYPDVVCNYLYYPVIMEDNVFADTFCQYLASKGIETRRYYTACHTLTAFKSGVVLPFTDSIKDRLVALPIHADMTDEEVQYLFETIKSYFG